MEKEKNDIEPEINETVDSEPDVKQDDIDKADLESLKLDATVEREYAMDRSEREKEENGVEKLLPAASEEEAMDEGVNSKDEDNRDPVDEVGIDMDIQLEQKDVEAKSTKKMLVGSCKSRPDDEGVKNG
jgi:hypothetical protein